MDKVDKVTKAPIRHVKKVWGEEQWMVNEPEYCMKLLVLRPGFQSSLHCHRKKKETMIVKKGSCQLLIRDWDQEVIVQLTQGDSITIRPGQLHQFWLAPEAARPCVLYEVSKHHSDDDVERLEESKAL
jgi:mannose-6-phosphate isomerase-like protein (cupin superfamily)